MSNKKTKRTGDRLVLAVAVLLALLLTAAVIALVAGTRQGRAGDIPTQTTGAAAETTRPIQIQVPEEVSIDLGQGLRITDVGSYAGVYMEDGSDDIVSDVMMLLVTNESDRDLQYARITLTAGERTREFSVSTLPAGERALLLEEGRMPYVREDYSAQVHDVVFFQEPLSLQEDRLALSGLDGAINVTNISGGPIEDDIVIYYKNRSADLYYGGITYRARIQGGLADGEIKQVMTGHFDPEDCQVLFVTCGG